VIGRSSSPQTRNPNPFGTNSVSKEKISLRDRSNTHSTNSGLQVKQPVAKLASHVYVVSFKKEIVMSYMLNTGYVGTYEPSYKLLYNKRQGY